MTLRGSLAVSWVEDKGVSISKEGSCYLALANWTWEGVE